MRRISTYTNGNSLWLLFNIVGTVMIYFWGLPQKQFTNGILSIGILGSDEEVAEADKAKQRHSALPPAICWTPIADLREHPDNGSYLVWVKGMGARNA